MYATSRVRMGLLLCATISLVLLLLSHSFLCPEMSAEEVKAAPAAQTAPPVGARDPEEVIRSIKEPAHCQYCHIDLSEKLRIRCAECVPRFELCGDCFSSGVELHPHTNSHAYRVIDCLHKPAFTRDWTALEDLKLLNGIDTFGLGNWKLISDFIGTKSARACDEHYWDQYLGRFGRCLPPTALVHGDQGTVSTESLLPAAAARLAPDLYLLQQRGSSGDEEKKEEELRQALLARQTELVNIPPPAATATQCSDVGSAVERFKGAGRDGSGSGGGGKGAENKKEQEIRDRIAQLPGADLAGYMPIRRDFDIEHDNEAEHLLTGVEFLASDYPAETAMKLSVVRAYNHRLAERNRRKKFAIERGLVDIRRQTQADRRRPKEDKRLLGHLKVFHRFQTEQEAVCLAEGVAVVRRLKKQIEAFKQYRRLGIRTLDQARAFEADRKRREHQVKATRSKQGGVNDKDPAYIFTAAQSELGACLSLPQGDGNVREREAAQRQARLLVQEAPNSELLTEAELDLCARTGMLPLHYLAVQEAVVRESFRNGTLTLDGFRRVVKVQREEQLDAKSTRGSCSSSIAGSETSSSSGLKRKAGGGGKAAASCVFDVHEDGISADAALQLFDFFVDHVPTALSAAPLSSTCSSSSSSSSSGSTASNISTSCCNNDPNSLTSSSSPRLSKRSRTSST